MECVVKLLLPKWSKILRIGRGIIVTFYLPLSEWNDSVIQSRCRIKTGELHGSSA